MTDIVRIRSTFIPEALANSGLEPTAVIARARLRVKEPMDGQGRQDEKYIHTDREVKKIPQSVYAGICSAR